MIQATPSQLHRRQQRKGKPVPYISHLVAVSALIWEDGGDEDQAIAGLLHDAIEDAGVSEVQIAARFGSRVARIVADCTDTTGAVEPGGEKEPWLRRKTRDMVLDARRDPAMWSKFNAGLEGSAWYLQSLHQIFCRRLEGSRSVEFLGESVQEILSSAPCLALVPAGDDPQAYADAYALRHRAAVAQQAE